MYIVTVEFTNPNRTAEEALSGAASELIGAWVRNGSVLDLESNLVRSHKKLLSIVAIPARNALNGKHSSASVQNALRKLSKLGIRPPRITFLGRNLEASSGCRCKVRLFLILFTHQFSIDSPIRCGTCFKPIPLYVLPRDKNGEYGEIRGWQRDYKACDELQIGCSTGERFAMHEMYDLNSSLSKRGLAICKEIQKATGISTYYYLCKCTDAASARQDEARRCPKCKRSWLLTRSLHKIFHFRCDKCGLLSNRSWNWV